MSEAIFFFCVPFLAAPWGVMSLGPGAGAVRARPGSMSLFFGARDSLFVGVATGEESPLFFGPSSCSAVFGPAALADSPASAAVPKLHGRHNLGQCPAWRSMRVAPRSAAAVPRSRRQACLRRSTAQTLCGPTSGSLCSRRRVFSSHALRVLGASERRAAARRHTLVAPPQSWCPCRICVQSEQSRPAHRHA